MKSGIYRFKSIEEQNDWEVSQRIAEGIPYWKWDRYEYARLHTKFRSGIYRFKTLREKEDWEFGEVTRQWTKQG
jgi:hypothetical protein